MIEMNWKNDDRSMDAEDYLTVGRCRPFLAGWTRYLDGHTTATKLDEVHWHGLGMVFASVLGNQPTEENRRQLYRLLLRQYLATDRVKHWTDEQRKQILKKADEE
jgi:hypothetical protein